MGFEVTAINLNIPEQASVFKKIRLTVQFLIKSVRALAKTQNAYVRYNPKMAILNHFACSFSKRKPIVFEHNIDYEKELTHLKRPIEKALHRFQLHQFHKFPAHHVAVTEEIRQALIEAKIPQKNTLYIQNGYSPPPPSQQPLPQNLAITLSKFRDSSQKLAIVISNGYRWHGIPEIIALLDPHPVQLIVIGPFTESSTKKVCYLGTQPPENCATLMTFADFGIGAFRQDLLGLTEGSPLKTREYLCHGLPILVNYTDSAAEIPSLAPYVFNQKTDPLAIPKICDMIIDQSKLAKTAQEELSWTKRFEPLNAIFAR